MTCMREAVTAESRAILYGYHRIAAAASAR
jgi:hypothetical protein